MRIAFAPLRCTGTLLLLFAGTLFSSFVNAGQGVWTSGGPSGAWISSLAIDPATPSTLYAGGSDAVFKSADSGSSWATTGLAVTGYYYYGYSFNALAIDPKTPSTLYAAGSDAVFKSTDSGSTWVMTGPVAAGNYYYYSFNALAIDPKTPTTLYAAGSDAVFKSTNSGSSWTTTGFSSPLYQSSVNSLAIDPGTPSTLYAGTYDRGVFKSTDSGGNWIAANAGLTSLNISALAIDPATPSTLYAATQGGIFKSSDSGATWRSANVGLTSLNVSSLAIDSATPSTLYAGTRDWGVFKSSDSGATWTAVNSNGLPSLQVHALALDPTGANLYAGLYVDINHGPSSGGVWQVTAPTSRETWTALLPASAHSPGANEAFYTTDLSVSNAGGSPASVMLKFLGNNQDGAAGREWTFFLDPGRSATIRDVLGSVFNETSSFGALRVSSNSPALNLVSVTSTPGFGGTFGQTIPVISSSDLIPAGSSRSILYIREGDGFRSNLVLASDASIATDVDVSLVSPGGSTLATKSYAVPPNGMTQINRIVRDMGVSGQVTGARLVLSSPTPGAAFTGFASMIDETTKDPTTLPVLPASVSGSGPWIWLLPATARSHSAGGAFYTTNLAVSNTGAAPASFTMTFLGHDQDGSAGPERPFNLDAGSSVTYSDVLGSVFGQSSNFGAIRITSDSPTLNVVSVTSATGFGGTISQTVPAVFSSDLIPAGSSRSILYIREGDGFRSNLILSSGAAVPTNVDVSLVSAEGVSLATKTYSVPPNGMTQINRVVRDMVVSEAVTGARLVLSSSTPGAAFTGFASVIDEATNDPTTIEAK